jgi:hypothetical protein
MHAGLNINEAYNNAIFRLNRHNAEYRFHPASVSALLLCATTSAPAAVLLLNESIYRLNSAV